MHANAIGGVRGEVHCALDKIVARYASERHPGRTVPTLHGKIDQAIERKGHGVGRLHRIAVVVLHRIDNYLIDALHAAKADLDPIRKDTTRSVIPYAAAAPVRTRALVVIYRRGGK